MKIKRKHQELTLIYIPDVNHPIRKVHCTRPMAWFLTSTLICGVLALVTWQISVQMIASGKITKLQEQLHQEQQQLHQLETSKDRTIEQLQLEILHLSEQASNIHHQMEQIKLLEKEIRILSEEQRSTIPLNGASITDHTSNLAQGGELHDITDRQIHDFIEDTHAHFQTLDSELSLLSAKLLEAKQQLEIRLEEARKIPSIWPTSSQEVTSGFGIRRDPFIRTAQFHYGIDISGKSNDPIYTTANGIIETTGQDSSKGNYITIDHENGFRTVYMHLHSITVKQGDVITKGEQIGTMGSTGRSTGVHLHYEIHRNGQEVDPMLYVPN